MKRLIIIAGALASSAMAPMPAAAQDEPGEKVNQLIIYGEDKCPQSPPGEITVCARMDESERYRIPETLRESDDPANESWTSRVQAYETIGDFGALSCTPSGAGGDLGCTQKLIDTAYAERKESSNIRFSELIQQAREERLSTIDEEAAETQARVEEIEREYDARQRREAEAAEQQSDAAAPGDQ
ncbi:hypothetical protein [Altericroceibacterium endophyticum]|uniref:DUF2799 domain-containing protein n=1 Tax=Altericroceibacterium endophyticum TaxID=1808508 RepID=A0A6I4T468_9SPHN|nr:hypothetical protein [Altericroceibacterium endophyticum]MXO65697.1 hypothetical protein [Altericroceibacterium endophyticum]